MNDDIIKTGPDAGKTELQLAAEVFDPRKSDEAYFRERMGTHAAQQMSEPEKFQTYLRDPTDPIGRGLRQLLPEDFANTDLTLPKVVMLAYMKSLKLGEHVMETGMTALQHCRGEVYFNEMPDICVRWETNQGLMGTSCTWGARRLEDMADATAEALWFDQYARTEQHGHLAVWLWLWKRINEACPAVNEVRINRVAYLLTCLSEECAEVAQDVDKIKRFGLMDRITHNPGAPPVLDGPTNLDRLVNELNDVMAMADMLVKEGILPAEWQDADKQAAKRLKVMRYMRYAIRKGVVVE